MHSGVGGVNNQRGLGAFFTKSFSRPNPVWQCRKYVAGVCSCDLCCRNPHPRALCAVLLCRACCAAGRVAADVLAAVGSKDALKKANLGKFVKKGKSYIDWDDGHPPDPAHEDALVKALRLFFAQHRSLRQAQATNRAVNSVKQLVRVFLA